MSGTEVEVLPPDHATVAGLAIRPDDRGALVRPAADLAEIVQAFEDYQAMCDRLLVGEDYQQIGSKAFRKKSAWRKLAVAFGVSTELVSKEYERDPRGRIIRAEVLMRAVAPNGRYMEGMGACDAFERCCEAAICTNSSQYHTHCATDCNGFLHFSKPSHDIPATAMTRATNRASADLFGFGEVSAEEVTDPGEHSTPARSRQAGPPAAAGDGRAEGPAGPPPEGFESHDIAIECHRLVIELIKALPEGIDRAPLRAYKAERGWPMSKADLDEYARRAGQARREFDEGEGRPFADGPDRPASAPETPAGASAPPETPAEGPAAPEADPETALERPCAACGEAEAVTAIDGVELCASCEAEEAKAEELARIAAGDEDGVTPHGDPA